MHSVSKYSLSVCLYKGSHPPGTLAYQFITSSSVNSVGLFWSRRRCRPHLATNGIPFIPKQRQKKSAAFVMVPVACITSRRFPSAFYLRPILEVSDLLTLPTPRMSIVHKGQHGAAVVKRLPSPPPRYRAARPISHFGHRNVPFLWTTTENERSKLPRRAIRSASVRPGVICM